MKKEQKIKVRFHNVKPTEQKAGEIKREIDKFYDDIFDAIKKEREEKKKTESTQSSKNGTVI